MKSDVDVDKDRSDRWTPRCGAGHHQVNLEVSPIDFAVTLFPGDVGSVYPKTNSAVRAFSLFNSQGVIDELPVFGIYCENTKSCCMTNHVSSRIVASESKPYVTSHMSQPLTTSDSSTCSTSQVSSSVPACNAACDGPSPAPTRTNQSSFRDSDVVELSSSERILFVWYSMFRYLESNLAKFDQRRGSVRFISGGKTSICNCQNCNSLMFWQFMLESMMYDVLHQQRLVSVSMLDVGLDLFNDDTCPSGHISRPTQVNVSQELLSFSKKTSYTGKCVSELLSFSKQLLKSDHIFHVWGPVEVNKLHHIR